MQFYFFFSIDISINIFYFFALYYFMKIEVLIFSCIFIVYRVEKLEKILLTSEITWVKNLNLKLFYLEQ